jgi:hypothetical protein
MLRASIDRIPLVSSTAAGVLLLELDEEDNEVEVERLLLDEEPVELTV